MGFLVNCRNPRRIITEPALPGKVTARVATEK